MTTDQFFGGVDGRIDNIRSMLQYLATESRSEPDLWDWVRSNTSGSKDSTIKTNVRFIRTLGLIEHANGTYTLTDYGAEYLREDDQDLLYSRLTTKVKGFETILAAIVTGDCSKDAIQAHLRAKYVDYQLPMGVVEQHLGWLVAIGYLKKVDGDYALTTSGANAVEALEPGWLEVASGSPGSRVEASESLEDLRKQAVQDGQASASSITSTRKVTDYNRSPSIRRYVKARAAGVCEGCDSPAPFENRQGEPYLEAHHIHEVSDGGPDTRETVIALCPNCHYRVHRGHDGEQFNRELAHRLASIEDVDVESLLS